MYYLCKCGRTIERFHSGYDGYYDYVWETPNNGTHVCSNCKSPILNFPTVETSGRMAEAIYRFESITLKQVLLAVFMAVVILISVSIAVWIQQ